MLRRSKAREVVLQLLFQRDLNPGAGRPMVERFVGERLLDAESQEFALRLYDAAVRAVGDIDARLSKAADNWRLNRMAAVDRNVLRLGACELLHTPDVPRNVALNEAIELARRFGSAESPAFVNGVLDRVLRESKKDEGRKANQDKPQ